MLLDLLRRNVVPNDLAVNMLLAHPASNQLGKLGPKVEHEDSLLGGSGCRSGRRLIRGTCFQTTVHDRQDSSPAAQAAASGFCTGESRSSQVWFERKRKLPLSQRQLRASNYITLQAGQKSRKSRLFCHEFRPVQDRLLFPPPLRTKTPYRRQLDFNPSPAQ
jgi:hypothetical protein